MLEYTFELILELSSQFLYLLIIVLALVFLLILILELMTEFLGWPYLTEDLIRS